MTRENDHNAGADPIWRPQVTVATIVPHEHRFLLVEEDVRGQIMFNQPAGHLESGESLTQAAVRETLEETGWDVELESLVAVHQWTNHQSGRAFLRFTFAASPRRHDPQRPLDTGILRTHWLSREDIAAREAQLRSPMILASIDAWLGGRRLPLDTLQTIESAIA